MDRCAQLKRFYNDCRLQVYIYAFMYVEPQTIPEEDHFPSTKTFFENYKKISTLGIVPKLWL